MNPLALVVILVVAGVAILSIVIRAYSRKLDSLRRELGRTRSNYEEKLVRAGKCPRCMNALSSDNLPSLKLHLTDGAWPDSWYAKSFVQCSQCGWTGDFKPTCPQCFQELEVDGAAELIGDFDHQVIFPDEYGYVSITEVRCTNCGYRCNDQSKLVRQNPA